MGVDEVLAALHGLSLKDLDRVRGAASGLIAARRKRKQDKTCADDTVERQVFDMVVRKAVGAAPTWYQFMRSPSYPKFVERLPVVVRWLDAHSTDLTQAQRYHLLDLGINLIVRGLVNHGKQPTVRLVCHCLGDISTVVGAAFPHYAEAGLLHMLARPHV